MAGPGIVVEGPPRRSRPYGLFSVLGALDGPDHWDDGGVKWETLGCDPVSGIGVVDCEPGEEGETTAEGLPKNRDATSGLGEATPFGVYAPYKCSPVGHTIEYASDRATQRLLAREEAYVEYALQSGALGNEPSFTGAESVGAGSDHIEALDALEQFIADNYGSQGVIHAPAGAAHTLSQSGTIITNGSVARTVTGTPVVFGSGYTNDDASTGRAWATPALFGYRGPVFYPSNRPGDLLDRSVNDLYAVAERTYLVGWDDCGVAVAEFPLGSS